MKHVIYLLLISSSLLHACSSPKEISFIQGNNVHQVTAKAIDTITIDRKPFSIRYFGKRYDEKNSKFYAAQIAVLDQAPDLNKIKTGVHTKNVPFFEPGSGMAAAENGYDAIFINSSAHHYLIYGGEKDRRVDLVSAKKKNLELEWKVPATVFYKRKETPLAKLPLQSLYFVIFIDANLNDVIDGGELGVVNVKLR